MSEKIHVFCRFRPPRDSKTAIPEYTCTKEKNAPQMKMVVPSKIHTDLKSFERKNIQLDHCFYPESTQEDLYIQIGKPLIEKVMQGVNASFLAYGYSGSGKTFSTLGSYESNSSLGLLPRMIHDLYQTANQQQQCWQTEVSLSVLELYQEKLYDLLLLSKPNQPRIPIKLREIKSGIITFPGCTEQAIASEEILQKAVGKAIQSRSVRSTKINDHSSRSHMICMVKVVQKKIKDQDTLIELAEKDQMVRSSILFVVDLAGSENVEKSGASGASLEEAKSINLSLTTLSRVIHTLNEKSSSVVIPYRESILTRVLRSSLGGNACSSILLACSPDLADIRGTWLTLLFGCQASAIVNTPITNVEIPIAEYQKMIGQLQSELDLLKAKIKELEDEKTQYMNSPNSSRANSRTNSRNNSRTNTPRSNHVSPLTSPTSSRHNSVSSPPIPDSKHVSNEDEPPSLLFSPRRNSVNSVNIDTQNDDEEVMQDLYFKTLKHIWSDNNVLQNNNQNNQNNTSKEKLFASIFTLSDLNSSSSS